MGSQLLPFAAELLLDMLGATIAGKRPGVELTRCCLRRRLFVTFCLVVSSNIYSLFPKAASPALQVVCLFS